jgi:DNA-binding MarR family transcriptional regulator
MKFPAATAPSLVSRSPSGPPQRNSKTVPFAWDKSPEQIVEANSLLTSVLRDLLYVEDRSAGLPPRQLWVCAALYDGPLPTSEVGRRLGMKLSVMTRLERAGTVTRLINGPGRRIRCLALTVRAGRHWNSRKKYCSSGWRRFSQPCITERDK